MSARRMLAAARPAVRSILRAPLSTRAWRFKVKGPWIKAAPRPRRATVLWTFLLAMSSLFTLSSGSAFAGEAPSPLPGDAKWLAPGADVVAFLTQTPGECLAPPDDAQTAQKIEIGRALFRSPLLLGGTAARSGLSCNACHRGGRDNQQFFLEGLSGAPGTADVTSALFSKTREDGANNPKPIPDLVGAGSKANFGSAGVHGLEGFISSAVTDEFEGTAMTPAALEGLAAYVRALERKSCGNPQKATLARAIDDARRPTVAARRAFEAGDRATAEALLLAAMQELSRIAERYRTLPQSARLIEAEAIKLQRIRDNRKGSAVVAGMALTRFEQSLAALKERLAPTEAQSLYNETRLRALLESEG